MVNRQNYLLAKKHLCYLREVMQLHEHSVSRYWFYLRHALLWMDETPLASAPGLRPTFPDYLTSIGAAGETGSLAPSTLKKIILTTKRFANWAKATYSQEYRHLPLAWIDSLRPPRRAQQPLANDHVFVTLDEVLKLVSAPVDKNNLALRRDQAAAAMLYLSGMRASAFCSLPLEAVDLKTRTIKQWPSLGVKTKNSKSATTYLLEQPELLTVVEKWDAFARSNLLPTAMWYTPIISRWGEQTLSPDRCGEDRNIALGKRLRKLFVVAGLEYKSPHKFRHGHAVYALQRAQTMADYKAVSMNLMHEDIRVTDGIYAPLLSDEVRRRIASLGGHPAPSPAVESALSQSLHSLSKSQMVEALHALAEALAR
ncbi:MAG: tyrosine-type recombinase/integrase [Chloroflexi bacterium]|nr:tyrosine-type recombinase/integrase [Chloroflexota bacterium]